MESAQDKQDNSDLPYLANVDEVTNRGRVVLYITRPEETKNCNFWIGLFKKGPVRPQDLYNHDAIEDVYYRAVYEGINDDEAILISNTEPKPPEHFYLLPLEQVKKSFDQVIEQITETIKAIGPSRAGFYFSRDLVNQEDCFKLLKMALKACRSTSTREFYLFAGKHGVNSILNTALDVKAELTDSLDVLVFH